MSYVSTKLLAKAGSPDSKQQHRRSEDGQMGLGNGPQDRESLADYFFWTSRLKVPRFEGLARCKSLSVPSKNLKAGLHLKLRNTHKASRTWISKKHFQFLKKKSSYINTSYYHDHDFKIKTVLLCVIISFLLTFWQKSGKEKQVRWCFENCDPWGMKTAYLDKLLSAISTQYPDSREY